MPGTSVQISTPLARSRPPNSAADVSEPPRPSTAVPPSAWRAMNPWVSSSREGCAAKRARQSSSVSRRHDADRRLPHSPWLGSSMASSQSRASHQPMSSPCARRSAAPSVDDSNSPCASSSACQSSERVAARGSATSAANAARRPPTTASGSRSSTAANSRWRTASACTLSAASAAPSAIAASSLVTPDSADTTTSTRASPSVARFMAVRPMVSQRWRCDTDVPPNLSTTQGVRVEGGDMGVVSIRYNGRRACRPAGASDRFYPIEGCPHMPRHRYLQLDVFADRPGAGNPLGVVLDADGLDDEAMQAIARWTRLPETTFVFPAPTPQASYGIRIFSPRREVPFAGHPSVRTAHAVLQAGLATPRDGLLVQSGIAGELPLRVLGEGATRTIAVRTPRARIVEIADPAHPQLHAALAGIARGGLPQALVDGGRRWWLAEVGDEASLRAATPDWDAIERLALETDSMGLCAFARSDDPVHHLAVRAWVGATGRFED